MISLSTPLLREELTVIWTLVRPTSVPLLLEDCQLWLLFSPRTRSSLCCFPLLSLQDRGAAGGRPNSHCLQGVQSVSERRAGGWLPVGGGAGGSCLLVAGRLERAPQWLLVLLSRPTSSSSPECECPLTGSNSGKDK